MLIYLTHVYSRLVHTPPIYLSASSNSEKYIQENCKKSVSNSFILHRRHLPLVKKIEIGKLYPHLNAYICLTSIIKVYLIPINSTKKSLRSPFFENESNKAPPYTC